MTMLAVREVAVGYYQDIDTQNDLSLDVVPGTITGVIGPNGAMKRGCNERSLPMTALEHRWKVRVCTRGR
jgi:ABC-type uncharacterized transport system ATPase subunit